MTSCPPSTSASNDTTRVRRLPPEYFVDTRRMRRVDLASLLVACGAVDVPVFDVLERVSLRGSVSYGIPKYRPPTLAGLYAAARFRWPGLFRTLRTLALVEALHRRPLKPIMFCTTDSDSSAI